jgi:hypothetical protein
VSVRGFLCSVVLAAMAPLGNAGAQGANVQVRVQVTDSAGARIAGADVAVTHGLREVIAHASTDASGTAALAIAPSIDNYGIVVRKIGFNRADRFFRVDSLSIPLIEIRLTRTLTALPTVAVTAEQTRKQRDYHLTADDLEKSERPVIDGTDILKLRPEMLASRVGVQVCGYVKSVWVNGVRVIMEPIDEFAISRRAALGIPPTPAPRTQPSRGGAPPASKSGILPGRGWKPPDPAPIDTVLSILQSIHPEHIAEVNFQDCLDNTVAKNHSDMAMFIALKPGIGFEVGRGSYVLANTVAADALASFDAAAAPASSTPRVRTVDSASINVANYPPYRFRVIGLFDDASGGTVEGAEIIDIKSGLRALTSATGTVSLFFLPDGGSTILVRKPGLRDTSFFAAITPADTTPITLLLRKP